MDNFEEKFKKVLSFVENSDIYSPNKPVVPHVKRVGEMLYKKGFADEIVIAGILHDILEWSSVTEENLRKKFGDTVADIVKVNSKDRSIEDRYQRKVDMVGRCQKLGDKAMAVRVSDVYDSFCYYSKLKSKKGINYSRTNASLWKDNLSSNLNKKFKNELNKLNFMKKQENKFVCTDCFKFNKCVESPVSWVFFLVGLIATVAIRGVNVVLDYSSLWAKILWYVGVAGFFVFFLYKFKYDHQTQKELKRTGLVEKVLNKEKITEYEYEVIGSILCKLKSKKEKINYFFIFFFSGVALLAAIYIDFIK